MDYDPELVAQIKRRHFHEHFTINAVAESVGLHRSTIRKICGYDPPPDEKTQKYLITPWIPIIKGMVDKYPKIPATTIFLNLKKRGYSGSLTTLRRELRNQRPRAKEAFMPMKVISGEQGQVDWGHFGKVKVGNTSRKLYLFVMVLSWSRAIYASFTFDSKTPSFLEQHRKAFVHFGGVPRTLLYDNLKSAVIQRYKKSITWNEMLLDVSGQFGFEPIACNPFRGNEKGRVERAIRYIRTSFFEGRSITSIDSLNEELREWLEEVSLERPWPDDSQKTVKGQWQAEREALIPLSRGYTIPRLRVEVKSGKTPFIRFDTNDYSIPSRLVRELLTVEADDHMVWVYHGLDLVAHHERSWSSKERILDYDHFEPKKVRYHHTGFQNLGQYPQLDAFYSKYLERDESLIKAKQALADLEELYGSKLFVQALEICQQRETFRPESVASILLKLEKQVKPEATPRRLKLPDHLKEYQITSHSLDQYDGL